jgi:hypothetical protein
MIDGISLYACLFGILIVGLIQIIQEMYITCTPFSQTDAINFEQKYNTGESGQILNINVTNAKKSDIVRYLNYRVKKHS